MDKVKKEMLKIYQPASELDWMNYKLVKKDVTFHHIVKQSRGGRRRVDNGALLMPVAHQYLHLIEYIDNDVYGMLNKLFKYVNQQQHEPTKEQREMIEYLLVEFEREHRWDKGSKGKILVQRKYLERGCF